MSQKWVENGRGPVGMSRGPTSEIEKIENYIFFQKFIKFHEMTGNDQKSVWEYHLGVKMVNFCDLGCPGRYSGVLERDFHVYSQTSKVGSGGEILDFFIFFEKSQNFMK